MNKMGMNTATKDTLMATTVKPMSRLPCSTAFCKGMPRSCKRLMCSSTTIASSTTNPVAIVSAISVKLFKLKWHRYITAHVPASDKGTATAGISAVRQRLRNKATTSTTKPMEMASDFWISASDARIVGVRSDTTSIAMPVGTSRPKEGNKRRTPSTASITFAPGCWYKTSNTAGLPCDNPSVRTSCMASLTCATSCTRTGRRF